MTEHLPEHLPQHLPQQQACIPETCYRHQAAIQRKLTVMLQTCCFRLAEASLCWTRFDLAASCCTLVVRVVMDCCQLRC